MLDSETYIGLYCSLDELIDISGSDVKCEDCKYFEPFNGVCFNGDSEHCADMPWQYGIKGCEKGEVKDG